MKQGFSLVELSIVLVILGLLAGGILTGQNLIRAAELRSVTTELQAYQTAVNTFQDRYFYWPGDMPNATDFWGASANCPGDNTTTTDPETLTCNGDGNGNVNPNAAEAHEEYRFWQHLANAGLVEGSYTGVTNHATATNVRSVIGWNVPRSKLSAGGWHAGTVSEQDISSVNYFAGSYGLVLHIGGESATGSTNTAIFTGEEVWNIDTKIDDGKPGLGVAFVPESYTSCHDAGTSSSVALAGSANYILDDPSDICILHFRAF